MIDVVGSEEFSGNPLAVVHDADRLSDDEMLTITRWFNLSETAFLVEPTSSEADYRVRIFTLRGELPFAGHPTLGACHGWLIANEDHNEDEVVQECGIGLVRLRRGEMLSFKAPPLIRSGPVEDHLLDDALGVLGITRDAAVAAEWVDNGPGWMGILVADRDAVMALKPDIGRQRGTDQLDIGVVAPAGADSDVDFEVRAFFADGSGGFLEDPVTGSLNASLGQWLIGSGRAPDSYIAAQGTALGRAGRAYLSKDDDGVWVGGATVSHVTGEID